MLNWECVYVIYCVIVSKFWSTKYTVFLGYSHYKLIICWAAMHGLFVMTGSGQ